MINLHELILKTKNFRQRLQQHIHLEELYLKKHVYAYKKKQLVTSQTKTWVNRQQTYQSPSQKKKASLTEY